MARISGLFYKVRNCINKSTQCMLYHNMVYCLIQYDIFMGTVSKTKSNSLKKLEKNLKIILS